MSDPIKVGDVVVVVGAHCPRSTSFIGKVFRVQALMCVPAVCIFCREVAWDVAPAQAEDGFWYGYLKRIPPLDDLEQIEALKEITA